MVSQLGQVYKVYIDMGVQAVCIYVYPVSSIMHPTQESMQPHSSGWTRNRQKVQLKSKPCTALEAC